MKNQSNVDEQGGISRWENDGGARGSGAGRQTRNDAPAPGKRRRSEQERLDASHQSDTRGEHRYSDVHQTGAEQKTRQDRDDLKQRLLDRGTRRAGQRQQRSGRD
jgi:hypothetical protein